MVLVYQRGPTTSVNHFPEIFIYLRPRYKQGR
jgi:hypothetical protein